MVTMHLQSEIKRYIVDNFLYGQDDGNMNEDVSLLQRGIIDSTGVLELVSFVQEQYGITVTDDELVPDNFDSINKIADFISQKRKNAG